MEGSRKGLLELFEKRQYAKLKLYEKGISSSRDYWNSYCYPL
jgi:hypothetical protein